MAQRTFTIPNFDKNKFMAWSMFTQAAYNIHVTLKDSAKTYVDQSKQSTNIDPPLAVGNSSIQGNNLCLIVDIPQSSDIKANICSYNVSRPDGVPAGYGFDICVEDRDDQDYNDLYVALICWNSKG